MGSAYVSTKTQSNWTYGGGLGVGYDFNGHFSASMVAGVPDARHPVCKQPVNVGRIVHLRPGKLNPVAIHKERKTIR